MFMYKLLILLFTVLLGIGMLVTDAQAKRFGGGKSFGSQRTIGTQPHGPAAAQAAKPQAATVTKPGTNRWMGPLAGLAVGGLLAYLFMGHGIGVGILSWLAIAVVLWLVWNVVRRILRPATSPSASFHNFQQTTQEPSTPLTMSSNDHTYETKAEVPIYPVGFDADDFLRNAKVQFLRLQAAYDSKNLNDLRDFNTPDVFAELQMQIHERGDQPNLTEVLHLDAKILEALDTGQATIVSVEFSGLIRENPQEGAAQFDEIWHFQKDHKIQKWLVAGIQQTN